MEDNLGAPVDTSAAPGSDAGLSPTIDTDTSEDTTSTSAATSGTDGDEKYQALLEKVAEQEKRIAHGSKTHQELKKAQESLQKYEQRFETWRRHQVDPDEIDRAIAAAGGNQPANPQNGKPLSAEDIERIVEQKVSMRGILDKWESQKDAWFDANPDYDSKVARKFFDTAAREIAQGELEENGAVLSTPKDIFKKAVKEWNQLQSTFEKRVKASMTQTREKVNQQGITETTHVKTKVDRGDDADKPETNEQWAARRAAEKARMRAGK